MLVWPNEKATNVVSHSGLPHPRFIRSKSSHIGNFAFKEEKNVCQKKVGEPLRSVDRR